MKKETINGCCAVCSNEDLLLCVDRTEYTPLKYVGGAWVQDQKEAHTEIINSEETIRLMCPACGEYHTIPPNFLSKENDMPGALIYKGPSRIDGQPIITVATWKSRNSKTGDMLQTYILREDIDPREANKYGEDFSICGTCDLKGEPTFDPEAKLATQRQCYVVLGQGPTIVHKSYMRGLYPDATHGRAAVGSGRMVRIGTYGDGAAVPDFVWDELLSNAAGHTAYTHNGGDPQRYMLSAASLERAEDAWRSKYRTFRIVKDRREIVKGQEIECPSDRGVQCTDCGLCAGAGVQAKSIAIVVHGGGAKYF